jgi:hypothetical protein
MNSVDLKSHKIDRIPYQIIHRRTTTDIDFLTFPTS